MMYWISKKDIGYSVTIQDFNGLVQHTFPTLTEAITQLRQNTQRSTGGKIVTIRDISFCSQCRDEIHNLRLREKLDDPSDIMEDILNEIQNQPQTQHLDYGEYERPMDNLLRQMLIYGRQLNQLVKEQKMIIHDLQEESSAAKKAIKYKSIIVNLINYLKQGSASAWVNSVNMQLQLENELEKDDVLDQ